MINEYKLNQNQVNYIAELSHKEVTYGAMVLPKLGALKDALLEGIRFVAREQGIPVDVNFAISEDFTTLIVQERKPVPNPAGLHVIAQQEPGEA